MSDGGPGQLRFDDGKDAQALRTIGEVSKALGLRQHVLRYWEQQFPTLQPLKRSGGRRYYRPEDVALVQTIDRLVNREGYTLKGARQALAGGAVQPVAEAQAIEVADILPHLRAIRARLARALEAA
jgi:DNA-binding transcriptional MerR regulator